MYKLYTSIGGPWLIIFFGGGKVETIGGAHEKFVWKFCFNLQKMKNWKFLIKIINNIKKLTRILNRKYRKS